VTKNITLRMDEELLRKAKHIAVKHDQSISAWIANLVRKAIEENDRYKEAHSFVLTAMKDHTVHDERNFTREEIHDRRFGRHMSGDDND